MRNFSLAVVIVSVVSTPLFADSVELISGDLLHGTVVEQSGQVVILEHPILGRIELPADQVQAVVISPDRVDTAPATAAPDGQVPGEQAAEDPPATLSPALPGVDWNETLREKLLPGFDKRFELGFNGSDGNSQTFNLNSAFLATKEDDRDRSKISATYYQNNDDGNRTRNEFIGKVVHDWLMPESPWFKFANGRLEYDEFQDWDTRISGFLGTGRLLADTPKHNLIARAGLGGSYEFGTVNELIPEALIGLEWVYQINRRQKLESYITLFPDLNEFGESRALAGTAWSIKIDDTDNISLKFGLYDEYESKTQGTAKHNDVKFYGALVFDF